MGRYPVLHVSRKSGDITFPLGQHVLI